MLGDVGEREVARPERIQQHDRRDGGGAEGGEERVARGGDQPPPACVGTQAAADRRVDHKSERERERGTAEILHLVVLH